MGGRERETLRLSLRGRGLDSLIKEIAEGEGVAENELRSGKRDRKVSRARRLICQVAVDKMGYPGAEVARVLKGASLLLTLVKSGTLLLMLNPGRYCLRCIVEPS
jgi:hypothetical protein